NLPRITGFTPTNGVPGTQVTVQGANFTGAASVRFKETEAAFTVNHDGQITTTVPAGAQTGPISVLTAQGRADSSATFVVGATVPNDHFANAQLLSGALAIAAGSTVGATVEAGEPLHAYTVGAHSIWYRWTAPSNGTWTVDLAGSDFDTLLGIYSGSSLFTLVQVAGNDDDGDRLTSRATFTATAGVTYRIAVDGYGDASGTVALRLYPATGGGVLYATGFELWEGFWGSALAGYGGWTKYGNGGNGVVQEFLPGYGQNAYIGYAPAPSSGEALFVWTPLDYTPNTNILPVVRFSVVMQIVDSSTPQYDDFEWQVYNRVGDRLFTLDFDNSNLNLYYRLGGSSPYVDTGFDFENGTTYALTMVMDFGANQWNAYLGAIQVVTNQPISVGGAALNLGDIDAAWIPGTAAGDNYMLFDDYTVRAEPSRAPVILLQPQNQSVTLGGSAAFGVVARGEDPLQYQWRRNGADLPGATGPVLALNGVMAAQAGSYSVVVRNAAGTVVSQNATLNIAQPPNLTPWQPAGWSAPLVVSTATNTTTDAVTLSEGQTLYLDWAVANDSDTALTNRFHTRLYVDNLLRQEWFTDGLGAHFYAFVTDFNLGVLSVGGHALRLETDTASAVAESNEGDNSFLKTIVVVPSAGLPPQLSGVSYPPGGPFQFLLSGEAGRAYTVQVSTNLAQWSVLTNVTGALTPVTIRDPNAGSHPRRFYRALLQTP
ncbi:MAG TPA: IPT/TIG domain-containing protein, partial [Verrucomicrobiae bacterium]